MCDIDPSILKNTGWPIDIRAIDKTSIHRICSGQAVLTLAVAVKELVENSIDAGATNIEIKLKEYGSEMIEVSDNGKGVEEKDFEGLALKHHTSKLQEFSDLASVETFGFRGEALSSLCALSDMCIVTKHEHASVGTKLEFNQNGRIKSKMLCPRQKGTTVSIQNLFYTLPVRHNEFKRNLKKEFAKMVQILNAYCIISVGLRVTCSNQVGKGSRQCIVSTNENNSLRENISNIFGSKQLHSLLELEQFDPSEEVCGDYGIKCLKNTKELFRLEGFVSQCEHGMGRSSTDRQFLFINQRPFESCKISKVANEVYHSYNRHQYPFLAICITRKRETVDVNVTPDKRQIFLQDEKILLATLKYSLLRIYEPTTSCLRIQTKLSNLAGSFSQRSSDLDCGELNRPSQYHSDGKVETGNRPEKESLKSSFSRLKRSFSSAFANYKADDKPVVHGKSPKQLPAKQRRLDTSISKTVCIDAYTVGTENSFRPPPKYHSKSKDDSKITNFELRSEESAIVCSSDFKCALNIQDKHSQSDSPSSYEQICSTSDIIESTSSKAREVERKYDCQISSDTAAGNQCSSPDIPVEDFKKKDLGSEHLNSVVENKYEEEEHHRDCDITLLELDEKNQQSCKKESEVKFSFKLLKEKRMVIRKTDSSGQDDLCRSFRATITPSENKSAEEELKKEIKKDMFKQMEILGQFNLGFIIAKLKDDLFIIDQHATDEKYNFETLQRTTVIQSQKMICPQSLELTPSNEIILKDNLEVFRKNGFEFVINENADPTQRVKLHSSPVSKNWNFGKEDVEELIFMLSDSPNIACRPSRIRQMFASRACRKSIMIGTALNKHEMNKIVCHMGEIEQPWNCPHGRPTMRHLINLKIIQRC